MKRFNTTGLMIAGQHYMVRIDRQVNAAVRLVEDGMYFTINRGRQYGKTTTLAFMQQQLEDNGYAVFSISFESLPPGAFESLDTLLSIVVNLMAEAQKWIGISNLSADGIHLLQQTALNHPKTMTVLEFRDFIFGLCAANRCVLLIDEVDAAGNHQEFINFLGILRDLYLKRNRLSIFQSVILAGVYDIKNLKLKMRPEDQHQYNSPWNIAAPFNVDMSLHADGIAEMLAEYKTDHQLTFDEQLVAQLVYDYTSGYPFLVSRLCQIIDEEGYTWDKEGVLQAVRDMLIERNTLFDDMIKKIDEFPQLRSLLKEILFSGKRVAFSTDEKYMQIASMFNFIKNDGGIVAIACRLMETRLCNLFIAEENTYTISTQGQMDRNQFIRDGQLDMRLILERFTVHFNEIFRPEKDDKFVEAWGRKLFLTYIRPVINGIGNYYVEPETRDLTRSDLVIDYRGRQYVVELKIWRGNSYNERGEQQLKEYLDFFRVQEGYLVSFCFNKNKQPGIHDVTVGDRIICEAIV